MDTAKMMDDSERQKKQFAKMTDTPVGPLIIKLAVPTTISMLVTNIYNMADTYFVGKINNSASAAVGIVFGLMNIIQAFGFMFGHGAGSIISRELGAKDRENAGIVVSTGFFYALLSGILITLTGFLFMNPLLRLLGSTDTILPYARIYVRYILIAAPLMTSCFLMNNVLRYEGMAAFSMIGLVSGGILNIFGDWYLMRVRGMGIAGAGLSTALSQGVSFIILLSVFIRKKTQSRLSIKLISKKSDVLKKIVATGIPSLIRQGMTSISTMLLNGAAGYYGDAAVAAMTIVNRICFFNFAVGLGIGQGFQPVAAFNYGAKKYGRVKHAFMFTLILGEIVLSLLAVTCMLFSSMLVGIFRNDPEVISIGTFALRVQLCSLFFLPLSVCTNMLFQSVGENGPASFLSMTRSGLFFIPLIIILPKVIGLAGVEISQTISDILTFFITIPFAAVFFRKPIFKEKNKCHADK